MFEIVVGGEYFVEVSKMAEGVWGLWSWTWLAEVVVRVVSVVQGMEGGNKSGRTIYDVVSFHGSFLRFVISR